MFYKEAIDYIKNIERSGSDFGIERMKALLELLGSPDKELKFVHIAGTNGKGSVSAFLTSIFKECGYIVGTYNSPSVFCYNERWLIAGQPLDDMKVAKYLTQVHDVIEQAEKCASKPYKGTPTAFEIETAVAMLAFLDNGCDICVLETGLGGRWDATNAIAQKEIAVITPIGLDHCAILGNTLQEISAEKAGIIKDLIVTCNQCDEVMNELKHPYDIVDGQKSFRTPKVIIAKTPTLISYDIDGQKFEYDDETYEISLLGKHQIVNASIALCAVETLKEKGFNLPLDCVKRGLKNARWRARFEIVKNAEKDFNIVIPQGKTLVFDGSHNPHGAVTLANAIGQYFKDSNVHLVFGMLKDKDVEGVVKMLIPLAKRVTCITAPSPRAMQKEELFDIVKGYCENCDMAENIKQAIRVALLGDCDVCILCGSLTLFECLKNEE